MTTTRTINKAGFPGAGIDTLTSVTGRNGRAIEDHFDANNGLRYMLGSMDKGKQLNIAYNIIKRKLTAFTGPNTWSQF